MITHFLILIVLYRIQIRNVTTRLHFKPSLETYSFDLKQFDLIDRCVFMCVSTWLCACVTASQTLPRPYIHSQTSSSAS